MDKCKFCYKESKGKFCSEECKELYYFRKSLQKEDVNPKKINKSNNNNNFYIIRNLKNMSAKDISNYLNVAVSTVYNWDNDKVKIPSDKIKELAHLFNISIEYFYKELTDKDKKFLHIPKDTNKGVKYDKHVNKWIAYVYHKSKNYYLGRFDIKKEAIKMRIEADYHKSLNNFVNWFEEYKKEYKKEKALERLTKQSLKQITIQKNEITINNFEIIKAIYKLSFEDIGKKLGVSRQCVSNWVNKNEYIVEDRIKELSEILNIPTVYFYKKLTNDDIYTIQFMYNEWKN